MVWVVSVLELGGKRNETWEVGSRDVTRQNAWRMKATRPSYGVEQHVTPNEAGGF